MSNFLTPLTVLLDMNILTKSTYRVALEGLDLSMVEILDKLGYEYQPSQPFFNQPSDVRLARAQDKLVRFKEDPRVGIGEFVQKSHRTLSEFFDVIYFGRIKDIAVGSNGCFEINLSCLLYPEFGDNKASAKKKFDEQIAKLNGMGITAERYPNMSHWQIVDNDTNKTAIIDTLKSKGGSLIYITGRNGYINEIKFNLKPQDIAKFEIKNNLKKIAVTDELNADEIIKMRKNIGEVVVSLAYIKSDPKMLNTCAFVAESCFSDICECVGFEGKITKRCKARHEAERTANCGIHEIETMIGDNFPVGIFAKTVSALNADINHFCAYNLHSVARNLTIDQWGSAKFIMKWITDENDFMYYVDEKQFENGCCPGFHEYEEVFHISDWDGEGKVLLDEGTNLQTVKNFLESIPGVRAVSYKVKTVGSRPYANDMFIIDEVEVAIDDLVAMIQWYDNNKKKEMEK